MIRKFMGNTPVVAPDAIVDESALLMGNVVVEPHVSIWPHALVRADAEKVVIKTGAAVLDKAFIEASHSVEIGRHTIISHGSIVHGSIIGDNVLVGIGAVVLEVSVGDDSIIAAGAVVTSDVDKGVLMAGVPARKVREVTENERLKTAQMSEELLSKAQNLAKKV